MSGQTFEFCLVLALWFYLIEPRKRWDEWRMGRDFRRRIDEFEALGQDR